LCAAQILWDFKDMGILDKLSTIPFHLAAIIFGEKVAPPISDDYNFYGLLKRFWMTDRAIKSFRKITYSITNLSDADQVGAKFFHLFYLSYLRDKNAMGCQMVTDNYSPALIDPFVKLLEKKGVKILLNRHIDDIAVENGRVKAVIAADHSRGVWLICPNCGLKFLRSGSDAFCPKCGKSWEISNLFRLWPAREVIEGDYFISAIQPHQFAKILKNEKSGLPPNHPLLGHPYFRALGQFKGAQLSFSRIYYGDKLTKGYNLTGLDRDYFIFNGAMDISNIMPRYANASVFDTLHDDGEVLEMYPVDELKNKTLIDLWKVFPKTLVRRPDAHLLARIYPDVLYHRPHPRLHSRFLPETQETPIENLYMAGDWTDEYQLGLEAAVKSGVKAANIILKKENKEPAPLLKPRVAVGVRLIQKLTAPLRKYFEWRYERKKPPHRG
ncbi:MAG: FAD-dependent oxidoreductase, partial [Patescibacteria group bacterium]